ncbi:hypothetical protein POF50_000425 [Streptomyces sp. SL13]|uniref:Uncharacterized protein n=1 Tax=Streptantibioticus silvisoli TaxID=2705255 RepID=A0AA90GYD0_9ACTN|nr:hypothetical protein [Streptantibioticus silvisoli]MDI5962318.1 hypothetical protein [Streptantibioticus silvisoli]MDI5967831.1 hypothetical protein [Streptantibioticus silvisoli]
MSLPRTHQCSGCSPSPASGTTLHEDLVVGAPLSMEDLTDAQRLERFSRKYAHDGCEVQDVRRVPHDSLGGYAWSVRFSEGS